MTTIAARIPEIVSTPEFKKSVVFFDGTQETWVEYQRSNGLYINMSVLSPGDNDRAEFFVAEVKYEKNGNVGTRQSVHLSLAEARILRDLLTRPDVQALLDAGDQH